MRRGDLEGFDALFRDEYAALERTAFLIVGDGELARELTQDAFAEALLRWARLSQFDRPGAWVRRVLIRKACRARDRGRRRTELERDALMSTGAGSAAMPSIEMRTALDALSSRLRSVVVLTYFLGMTSEEVGHALECPASTVRSHLRTAREQLAELLDDTLEGEPHGH